MATENSGPHLPSSWPEASQRDAPGSWSGAAAPDVPTSWPETPAAHQDPSWPEPPRKDGAWPEPPPRHSPRHDAAGPSAWPDSSPQNAGGPSAWPDSAPQNAGGPSAWPDSAPQNSGGPSAWPDAGHQDVPMSWPDATAPGGPTAWPETAAPGGAGPSWADGSAAPGHVRPPVPAPVPAWAQPPAPAADAWSNLSSPAPWPPGDRTGAEGMDRTMAHGRADAPPRDESRPPPAQPYPGGDRTAAYAQPSEALLNDRAIPSGPNPSGPNPAGPMDSTRIGAPPGEDQGPRPGSNLSRDPSDPDRPFVTAGQVSGSRTPPPERQQELWNTVFGDNYESMDDGALDDEPGKPIWIYALGGSVAIALVAALLWAFLAGPLAGSDEPTSAAQTAAPPKASATRTSTTIGALPQYPGKASPVVGRVPDLTAGLSLPRMGGQWQLDQRATVKATYGYDTRQYVQIAPEKFANLMSGPLSPKLLSYYEQDDLEPVIKQVVLNARKRFFPADNKVRKIAQQSIKVGDATGRLIAYSLTSETEKATIVTMAVNTGGQAPAIVYMSIPSEGKQLLPDIRRVLNQLKLSGQ
ncbi:hypothetical protein [Nonomuraea sp. NPDC002799]